MANQMTKNRLHIKSNLYITTAFDPSKKLPFLIGGNCSEVLYVVKVKLDTSKCWSL